MAVRFTARGFGVSDSSTRDAGLKIVTTRRPGAIRLIQDRRGVASAGPPAVADEDEDEIIEEPDPETGDDDTDEDLDDFAASDFYADALEDA